ncbi:MAG: molybdopterin-dependent oxidoreductase [Cyanobacteria bacterium SZAS LIN-5]|nr:molybdopterin-dependent oxidoreductase [Cyanobacteria bacterium SZAS LIN-5]
MTAEFSHTEPDPLAGQIARAHDSVMPQYWAPPRNGVTPQLRIGKRWFNVLWLIPISVTILVISAGAAHELRALPVVSDFIARYPGQSSTTVYYSGFPVWLRVQHVLNLFLMMFIIRSGIQILADHPRLYWNKDCTPGTEWFRFQREVPRDVLWTAKDDAVTIPKWLGIPGIRHSIGLARWWHFSCDFAWLLNGVIFYGLLFASHQWQRLVPTSWDVFPNALSTALQYLSFQMPYENGWIRYNSLQQLAYFTTVFIAAPLAVITGLMQAPAIANNLGQIGRMFHRQAARSIHFLIMLWFVQFTFIHVSMVVLTGVKRNLNHITLGTNSFGWNGTMIALVVLVFLAVLWLGASSFTLKNARLVQKTGRFMVGWIKALMEMRDPTNQFEEKDISPFLWPNGLVPTSKEFQELYEANFVNYSLSVGGLVENTHDFSYEELLSLPKQEQTTEHFCIQGWSGIARWGGVPMTSIMDIVKPLPHARFAVFYSFGEGGEGGTYYDVHSIANMRHQLTILAYEMNGKKLPLLHGAPVRLRCENEIGFKQVKWIRSIEFVADFNSIGSGQGGYNEDHEFYGYRMPI